MGVGTGALPGVLADRRIGAGGPVLLDRAAAAGAALDLGGGVRGGGGVCDARVGGGRAVMRLSPDAAFAVCLICGTR